MIDLDSDNYAFLDTMNELLGTTSEFIEHARHARDDVMLGSYLKLASRALRCALEIYGDHLAQNRVEMELGEER